MARQRDAWTQFQSPLSTRGDHASGLFGDQNGMVPSPARRGHDHRQARGRPAFAVRGGGRHGRLLRPTGFVPSVLAFGRAGCWQLNAKLEDHVLRVVFAISRPKGLSVLQPQARYASLEAAGELLTAHSASLPDAAATHAPTPKQGALVPVAKWLVGP